MTDLVVPMKQIKDEAPEDDNTGASSGTINESTGRNASGIQDKKKLSEEERQVRLCASFPFLLFVHMLVGERLIDMFVL